MISDWGWGFIKPRPHSQSEIPPATGDFQQAMKSNKKGDRSLPKINYLCIAMYSQLTSEQRSQIFVLLQKQMQKKVIAQLVGISQSTLSRELKRNMTEQGHYLWDKAHAKAMERRRRTTTNSKKDPLIVWEALDLLKQKDWSPEQISGYMRAHGKSISHELIYRHIRADLTGELSSHCRHKMKYNRHGRPKRTTKVKNIPRRVSIHQRPAEANGKRFGDWEMDTIVGQGRAGKGRYLP